MPTLPLPAEDDDAYPVRDEIEDYEEESSEGWSCYGEYGYADAFVTAETWEDQAGMEEIKRYLAIPDDWYLIKIIDFTTKKLLEIEEWLKDHCRDEYRQVNWRGGCTTKIGVAIKDPTDAVFFKLRWR